MVDGAGLAGARRTALIRVAVTESCSIDPLCQAVEAAWNSGIAVVTAAGNLGRNGYATILSPGNSPHAITVVQFAALGRDGGSAPDAPNALLEVPVELDDPLELDD